MAPSQSAERRPTARPQRARARETRTRLMAAGRKAFAEKGLAGTNLKADVLDPAGVSVGSFYHQFDDKTDLLLTVLAEHSDDFRARLQEAYRPKPGRTLEQLVRDAYEVLFADLEANTDLTQIQLRERFCGETRVREFLRSDRDRWIETLSAHFTMIEEAAGLPHVAEGAAEMILSLAHGAIGRFIETPATRRRAARTRLVENLVRFSMGGVAALVEPDRAPAESSNDPSAQQSTPARA